MEVAEVSTRSIAEIDLKRSLARHVSQYSRESHYLRQPQTVGLGFSTDVPFLGMGCEPQYNMLVFPLAIHEAMLGGVEWKTEREGEQESEGQAEVNFRVAFEDIEPFVGTALSSRRQSMQRPHDTQANVQYRTLTNRLRSVASNERSRPILDIEETRAATAGPLRPKKQVPVTVSPALQRQAPTTKIGGLGHVSAGLLLWLESSEAKDEDA